MTSILKVDSIQNAAGTAAMTIDSGGVVAEPNKEYFQVDLTTDQTQTDNSGVVVDFGGKGTVIYDTKSKFDSANDAYLLGSSDGVYLINFSIGISSVTVTTESIIYAQGGLEVATDGSTYSALKGGGSQLRNNDGDAGGSVTFSGSVIYKATTATTKIRMQAFVDSTGSPNYKIGATASAITQGGGDLNNARVTWISVVRIA